MRACGGSRGVERERERGAAAVPPLSLPTTPPFSHPPLAPLSARPVFHHGARPPHPFHTAHQPDTCVSSHFVLTGACVWLARAAAFSFFPSCFSRLRFFRLLFSLHGAKAAFSFGLRFFHHHTPLSVFVHTLVFKSRGCVTSVRGFSSERCGEAAGAWRRASEFFLLLSAPPSSPKNTHPSHGSRPTTTLQSLRSEKKGAGKRDGDKKQREWFRGLVRGRARRSPSLVPSFPLPPHISPASTRRRRRLSHKVRFSHPIQVRARVRDRGPEERRGAWRPREDSRPAPALSARSRAPSPPKRATPRSPPPHLCTFNSPSLLSNELDLLPARCLERGIGFGTFVSFEGRDGKKKGGKREHRAGAGCAEGSGVLLPPLSRPFRSSLFPHKPGVFCSSWLRVCLLFL